MLCLSYIFVFIFNCICTLYLYLYLCLYTRLKVSFNCSKAMWRDAGMQITIKIEAGLQFSAKGGSARQIAHIFCRQQFARLDVQFLPTMFQHSRTDLKCNLPLSDMEVDVPPSNSAQTPPISHFTSLEWSPAVLQCSLQCAVHLLDRSPLLH